MSLFQFQLLLLLLFLFLSVSTSMLTARADDTGSAANVAGVSLQLAHRLIYPDSRDGEPTGTGTGAICDVHRRSCAPLSDIWAVNTTWTTADGSRRRQQQQGGGDDEGEEGTRFDSNRLYWNNQRETDEEKRDEERRGGGGDTSTEMIAVVGVFNGVSIVQVPALDDTSQQPTELAFEPGCLTQWRDLKNYREFVYVVHDRTALCSCSGPTCQLVVRIDNGTAQDTFVPATVTRFSANVLALQNVTAPLTYRIPYDGCDEYDEGRPVASIVGKILLIQRGTCTIVDKVLHAQRAGAVGVLIINDRYELVPPSFSGDSTGISIPALAISQETGNTLVAWVQASRNIVATLSNSTYEANDLYREPDGLVVLDIKDPSSPKKVFSSRKDFDYAHNIFVEYDRPYLYACGFSCLYESCGNGGVLMFDISTPQTPVLVAKWDDFYVHDLVVDLRPDDNRYVLYASGIYDGSIFVLDVTDPAKVGQNGYSVTYFKTPLMTHNSWPTMDGRYLYVTHEDYEMAVTIWNIEQLAFGGASQYIGNVSIRASEGTSPHNAMICNNYLWISYYTEGVAVYDVSVPESTTFLASFDTSVQFDNGFHGNWGIYPMQNNKGVMVSDMENGLFVFSFDDTRTSGESDTSSKSVVALAVILSIVGFVAGIASVITLYKWHERKQAKKLARGVPPKPLESRDDDDDGIRDDDEADL